MSDFDDSIDEAFDKLFREIRIRDHAFITEYKTRIREALRKSGFQPIHLENERLMSKITARLHAHWPDFDALYKYKAELDNRLHGSKPPEPPAAQR